MLAAKSQGSGLWVSGQSADPGAGTVSGTPPLVRGEGGGQYGSKSGWAIIGDVGAIGVLCVGTGGFPTHLEVLAHLGFPGGGELRGFLFPAGKGKRGGIPGAVTVPLEPSKRQRCGRRERNPLGTKRGGSQNLTAPPSIKKEIRRASYVRAPGCLKPQLSLSLQASVVVGGIDGRTNALV
ncbi:hypothetical protein NDU88_006283 [Pleurodeles waltl]|uniref:Uncharacterized protein n=1 Tax=Pleurodeles waltl TaxID=8319 RepID=A0AAV7WD54_PLEWA|nr:hypothetical protein NDU88_006283 [Pleurodeles waltl]